MITCKEGQHHLVRMRKGFLGSTEMLKIMTHWRSSGGYRTVGCWERCPPSPPRTLSSQSPRRSSAPSIWILHRCQRSHSHEICQPQNVDLSLKNCKKIVKKRVPFNCFYRGNAQFYMMYGDAWNCMWEKWGRIRMICTLGASRWSQIHALRIHPAEDADKVRHKAGDGALEDGIIAEYHRLVERVTLVRLLRNWKLKFDQELCSPGE